MKEENQTENNQQTNITENNNEDIEPTLTDEERHANYEKFDWYETPLYYDIIFDMDTNIEATALQHIYKHCCIQQDNKNHSHTNDHTTSSHHQQHSISSPPLLFEPACGTGRLMCELYRRGFSVVGFDNKFQTIKFAEQRFNTIIQQQTTNQQQNQNTESNKEASVDDQSVQAYSNIQSSHDNSLPFYQLYHADMVGFKQQQPKIQEGQKNWIVRS